MPRKQLVSFTRQLSTLQDAGLPILRSLQILEQQQKPGLLKAIIGGVADEVEGGGTLSDAMAKYPKAFDKLYVNMINAGEAGGVLDLILARLADFMEKAAKLKKKVIGAMIYPAVVITHRRRHRVDDHDLRDPQVRGDLQRLQPRTARPRPSSCSTISRLRSPTEYGWAYVLASPFVIIGLIKLIRMSEGGKYAVDVVKLKIPILGGDPRQDRHRPLHAHARHADQRRRADPRRDQHHQGNRRQRGLRPRPVKVHDAIREGESMADPLRATKVCDAIVVNMIDVGEETGDLDKMLMKVADNYDNDVDVLVGSLISILEPVMVVVLGVIVGFIVIALFMPMITPDPGHDQRPGRSKRKDAACRSQECRMRSPAP